MLVYVPLIERMVKLARVSRASYYRFDENAESGVDSDWNRSSQRTSASAHRAARQMMLTDVDQLWRADITYIRLREEFVFLAVVLDAYSRRVIGWALGLPGRS